MVEETEPPRRWMSVVIATFLYIVLQSIDRSRYREAQRANGSFYIGDDDGSGELNFSIASPGLQGGWRRARTTMTRLRIKWDHVVTLCEYLLGVLVSETRVTHRFARRMGPRSGRPLFALAVLHIRTPCRLVHVVLIANSTTDSQRNRPTSCPSSHGDAAFSPSPSRTVPVLCVSSAASRLPMLSGCPPSFSQSRWTALKFNLDTSHPVPFGVSESAVVSFCFSGLLPPLAYLPYHRCDCIQSNILVSRAVAALTPGLPYVKLVLEAKISNQVSNTISYPKLDESAGILAALKRVVLAQSEQQRNQKYQRPLR
ncbi:hypothetical protein C8R45DRAFT_1083557 [Mycena sanguinolenta]|nr:hypothetical protein C8R45DRAFT_1083557 [Mycena sanguinolenta]